MLLLAIAAVFVLAGSGKPGEVKNLSSKSTYSGIDISWEPAAKADGYYVYASKNGDSYERIATVEPKGDPSYWYYDFERDTDYSFKVSAFNKGFLSKNVREGEASEAINDKYETDKYAQKIPVLGYHSMCPADAEPSGGTEIKADDFEEQMKYLHDNGYTTLTPDEFYRWHARREEFPVKTVMITFDDGDYSNYYLLYPILKKYDIAATSFLIGKSTPETTSDFSVEYKKDHYIGLDRIKQIKKEYPRFCFESHTYDMHNRVNGKKPAKVYTYEQIMEDCKKNKDFGFRYLAYPWGAYSDVMQKALEDSGYRMAFAYNPYYYALRSDDRYAVNRIKVSGTIGMDEFKDLVSGNIAEYDRKDAPENTGEHQ